MSRFDDLFEEESRQLPCPEVTILEEDAPWTRARARDELTYWKPPEAAADLDESADGAWRRALHGALRRQTDAAAIPALVGALAPRPAIPAALARENMLVLDTLRMLEPGTMAWGHAADEAAEFRREHEGRHPVLVVRISALVAMDPGFESFALTFEVVSRLQTASRYLILLGTATEAERLSRRGMPLDIIRVSPALPPRCLRPVVPEPCLGREREIRDVVDLVLAGRNPLVTGPAGTGKTVLARSIAAHPDLADREIRELDVNELLAGAEYRGVLDARVNEVIGWAAAQQLPPVVIADELVGGGKVQRTGRQDAPEGSANQDSLVDMLKGELSKSRPSLIVVGTATDAERAALHRLDPAITRRFSEVRLKELAGTALDEAVAWWGREHGLGRRERRRIARLAPRFLPEETAIAAVVKVMGWCRGREGGVLDVLRERFGELAAPRRARLLAGLAGLDRKLWQRGRELGAVRQVVEAGLEQLVRGGDRAAGPFMGLLIMGTRGSGKSFFARSVAEALGAGAVREIGAGREELARFVKNHASVPGGAVIVRGGAADGPPAAGEPGGGAAAERSAGQGQGRGFSVADAMEVASALHRWLVCIVVHSDPIPEGVGPHVLTGPFPVAGLPLRPVVPAFSERLALARRMAARMRESALDQGIAGRVGRPAASALEALAAEPLSPDALEARVAGLVLGRAAEQPAQGGGEGGVVLPLFSLGLHDGPEGMPRA